MKYYLICLAIIGISFAFKANVGTDENYFQLLSEYQFFKGPLRDLNPFDHVIPYDLNAPLFSDYAQKSRFIYFPKNSPAKFDSDQAFNFEDGTVIIKNFFYFKDERKPYKGKQIIETRLLIKKDGEWTALPYVWNEKQDEAYLEVAGADIPVEWKNAKGNKMTVQYAVPNMNQCKGCHIWDKEVKPIGPNARQLNKTFTYPTGVENQLSYWADNGYLKDLPPHTEIAKLENWNSDQNLETRARAYLDANCGHCHNPHGPANTSGLFLNAQETDDYKLGFMKPPVAAGRGAGNKPYNIVPGSPDKSILLYRMESQDPGVMMPELGRKLPHKEGIELIREWIEHLQ